MTNKTFQAVDTTAMCYMTLILNTQNCHVLYDFYLKYTATSMCYMTLILNTQRLKHFVGLAMKSTEKQTLFFQETT